MANIVAICTSSEKGTIKSEGNYPVFVDTDGIKNDAHRGKWHRQVSLLAKESVDSIRDELEKHGIKIKNGSFAENILTEGIDLKSLKIGTRLSLGDNCVLEITQIGKECHNGCDIKKITGKCVMPTDGVFAKVISTGFIDKGDIIKTI